MLCLGNKYALNTVRCLYFYIASKYINMDQTAWICSSINLLTLPKLKIFKFFPQRFVKVKFPRTKMNKLFIKLKVT